MVADESGAQGGGKQAKPTGFLEGVRIEDVTDELRKEYTIEADVTGVVVTSVEESSAAAKVGLQEGDVILQVNRQPVKTAAEARAHRRRRICRLATCRLGLARWKLATTGQVLL